MAGGRGVRKGWAWGKEKKGNRMRREVEMGQEEGWKCEEEEDRNGTRVGWKYREKENGNGGTMGQGQGGNGMQKGIEMGRAGQKWDKEADGNGARRERNRMRRGVEME